MSLIKTTEEIEKLREGGQKLATIRDELARRTQTGVSASELDEIAQKLFREAGGVSSFFNFRPRKAKHAYPAHSCVSVNDVVVHGLPSAAVVFKEGDIVGIDVGMKYRNLFTDTAVTVAVGSIAPEVRRLLETTEKALAVGIAGVRAGATTGDIGFAIQDFVKKNGNFGIVRTLGGHGVGHAVHEEPHIPNFGNRGEGEKLVAGMVIAIEPMLTLGSPELVLDTDGHSFRTKDGSFSAHFEHTVLVTERGAEVLTMV